MITSIIFDFGGVIAEEGFKEGLCAIGARNRLDPERFFVVARELIYETGYITGHTPERAYWDAVRRTTGVQSADVDLREEIISRFILRPDMLDEADRLWTIPVSSSFLGKNKTRRFSMRRGLAGLTALLLLLCAMPSLYGADESESTYMMETKGTPYQEAPVPLPSEEAMIMDVLFVRPLGFVGLVIGTGMSIIATPLALASGTIGPLYERLVVEPFDFTICRPLGAF